MLQCCICLNILTYCRVPIEALFYHGKNPRGKKNKKSTTTTTTTTEPSTTAATNRESESDDDYDDDDYYYIWGDYYDTDTEETEENYISTNSPVTGNPQTTNSTKQGGDRAITNKYLTHFVCCPRVVASF